MTSVSRYKMDLTLATERIQNDNINNYCKINQVPVLVLPFY